MRKIIILAAVLFVCAFITSCHKDAVNRDLVIPPVITIHDSVTRISKLIFFNAQVSPDTAFYWEYLYDSRQRVTNLNLYEYINGLPVLGGITTYHYTGSDSMAYKKTFLSTNPLQPTPQTTFYFYDNLLRLIKDSTVFDSGLYVSTFQYSSKTIIAIVKRVYNNPAYSSMTVDTGFIGSTGNVIRTYRWNGVNNNKYSIDSLTYDNNANPYYQLNIRSTYFPLAGDERFLLNNLQKNNLVLASTRDHDSNSSVPITYTYTYNLLGLPDTEDVSKIPFFRFKFVFIYKKIY